LADYKLLDRFYPLTVEFQFMFVAFVELFYVFVALIEDEEELEVEVFHNGKFNIEIVYLGA
jgi:hypothetical protein